MNRCVPALLALVLAFSAQAQTRRFPPSALRGELAFGPPPFVTVNGQEARLAAGARIRNQNNVIVTTGSVTGAKFTANYTRDSGGQVLEVWMLRPDEARNPWPGTQAEADTLVFDADTQTWTRK